VGAGGKKTILYRIANAHPGHVGLTSTVFMAPFPRDLDAHRIISDEENFIDQVIEASKTQRVVAFAHHSSKKARMGGLAGGEFRSIREQAGFDVLLVKADGARMRAIKAPTEREPNLPENTTTVLGIVSAKVLGERLSEVIAHRIECVKRVTGLSEGDVIKAEHVARLITSKQGLLKGVGDATLIPVINAVDDDRYRIEAERAAQLALDMNAQIPRIVLSSMLREDPIVGIVTR